MNDDSLKSNSVISDYDLEKVYKREKVNNNKSKYKLGVKKNIFYIKKWHIIHI